MANCPCCGQETKAIDLVTLAKIVSPTMGEMVDLLASQPGQFFTREQIARHIWRRTPEGGPEFLSSTVANMVNYNKRRLHALGWDIEGRLGSHGGYRLVMRSEAVA